MTSVDVAFPAALGLGEGPVWDDRTGTLLFVDIQGHRVYRGDPTTGELSSFGTEGPVGTVALREDGGLVLADDRQFRRCGPAGEDLAAVPGFEATGPVRFNDGKVDPHGRFLAGTMHLGYSEPVGALYRLSPDGSIEVLFGDVTLSNGLDWSPDGTRMYYADSATKGVDVFDVDAAGGLHDRRRLITWSDEVGGPDGLTVDAEGGIWVACWHRGVVQRHAPDGRVEGVVELPVAAVTSVSFGGADLGDLYVTTAHRPPSTAADVDEPLAGHVFVTRPGVAGKPPFRFGAPG